MFLEQMARGVCVVLPEQRGAKVEEVGKRREPVTWVDGRKVRIEAVKVGGVWSITFEPIGPTV